VVPGESLDADRSLGLVEKKMIEYHVLRVILGILLIVLVRSVRRIHWTAQLIACADAVFVFRVYWTFSAILHLLPARVWSGFWWRGIWLPLEIVHLGMVIGITWVLFDAICWRLISRLERQLLVMMILAIGGILIIASWHWMPGNVFQALLTIRQYLYLVILVGVIWGWWWFTLQRPLTRIPDVLQILSLGWIGWIFWQFVLSTTGAGGMIWTILPRTLSSWKWTTYLALSGQIGVSVYWLVSLRNSLRGKP
jgi:hypothetical protein